MRSHLSTIIPRMIRAGLRVSQCRVRVVAAGVDSRGRIISISTNSPRLPKRGMHAEEKIIHTSPRSLRKILLLRVGARGALLPIHACSHCQKLADKHNVKIERVSL